MDDWKSYYQTRFQFDSRRSLVWRVISEFLQKEIPDTGCVLELGAGYCYFINHIRAQRKLAVDVSEVVREAAAPDVEVQVRSCTSLDFLMDASVDVVFASNLLEHLDISQIEQTLREVKRVLKCGGKLIVLQPNFRYCYKYYFDDYTHRTIFTHVGLRDLVAASGFEISRLVSRFMPFSLKSRLPVNALLIRLYLHSPFRPFAGQMLIVARKPSN